LLISSAVFGRLGDIFGRKRVVIIGFFVSAVVAFAHNFIRDIPSLLFIRSLAGIGAGMIPGPLAALAWGSPLGVFTACGSLGFTMSSVLAGVLKKDFFIFTASALLCMIGFAASFIIKEKQKKILVPLFPYNIIVKNLKVYLPYLIRHSAATAIWAIFPIYLVKLGADKFWIGIIYGINPLMQFTFMLLLDRFKSTRLITIGLIASACTFLGYAIAPHWHLVLFLQVVLGFSWANLYLGSMKYLLENNIEQATATGILSSVFGLSGIIGPLIGGVISLFGLRPLLFFSSVLAFGAFITSRSLRLPARLDQHQQ
jgi:DHA1 family quinolone resistance protein-like MFS transporter